MDSTIRSSGDPPRRPRLADDMRPPLDRIVQSMVRPDPADGVVLDRLGVGDRAVEVEHERFDDGAGRAHASAATVASTRPSSECGSATAATVSPALSATPAVTGPIATTTGGTAAGPALRR